MKYFFKAHLHCLVFFGVCFKQQQQKDLFQAVHVNITLKSVLFCFESDKHLTK